MADCPEREGHEVVTAQDGQEGLDLIVSTKPDVSMVDLKLPVMDGLAITRRALKARTQNLIIHMTAHGSIRTAVEAMKLGAFDYLAKPLDVDEVLLMLQKCREKI